MNARRKRALIKLCEGAFCFAILLASEALGAFREEAWGKWLKLALYVALYLYVGVGIVVKAVRSLMHGHVFGENMLMSIATVCAFFIGEYHEAVALMLFYGVGEWFQGYAVARTKNSVVDLMKLREDRARVLRDGSELFVKPATVQVGEVIVVHPGERISLDGEVVDGDGAVDVSSLTGEAIPCEVGIGSSVMSGSVNLYATLKIRVSKVQAESTAMRILSLISEAGERKSKAEAFITKFARKYTPAVIVTALLLFVIGGAITGDFADWGYRALNFLVVSCPCALVVSVPLAFFAGIGRASKNGVLIKGAVFVEALARTKCVAFDKTGTLTEGDFTVTAVYPESRREQVLRLASIAESASSHPIARSIVAEYGKAVDEEYSVTSVGGMGVVARGEHEIACGSARLMTSLGISVDKIAEKCVVYVAVDGAYFGAIALTDRAKSNASDVVNTLNGADITTIMLTGDNDESARKVADELGIASVKSSLLPDQKLGALEEIICAQGGDGSVCFVGDGVNDAPSLIRADVGISMGGLGSDAAIEASDVVIMQDDLAKIPFAIDLSKRTMNVVGQNVAFCLAVKGVALVLGALGVTGLLFSVFADVGVAVLAILNSVCLLKNSKKKELK